MAISPPVVAGADKLVSVALAEPVEMAVGAAMAASVGRAAKAHPRTSFGMKRICPRSVAARGLAGVVTAEMAATVETVAMVDAAATMDAVVMVALAERAATLYCPAER